MQLSSLILKARGSFGTSLVLPERLDYHRLTVGDNLQYYAESNEMRRDAIGVHYFRTNPLNSAVAWPVRWVRPPPSIYIEFLSSQISLCLSDNISIVFSSTT